MKKMSAGWFWFLLALLYAACSLTVLDRNSSQRSVFEPAIRVPPLPPGNALTNVLTARHTSRSSSFSIPFTRDVMDAIRATRFRLTSSTPLRDCMIQVIVESDHHFSFSHVYQLDEVPGDGYSFSAPFRRDPSYWTPVGHDGQWSAWEATGLRKLEVKVFTTGADAADLTLGYAHETATNAGNDVSLAWSCPMKNPIRLGERFELAFDIENWFGNPFARDQLRLSVEITPPTGDPVTVFPFLYQNFEAITGADRECIRPRGAKQFRARYRPAVAGVHTYALRIRTAEGTVRTLSEGQFSVNPGTAPDFIRISGRSQRYFEHSDGRFFYPIGWNMAYPVDNPYKIEYVPYLPVGQSLSSMKTMLDDLSLSGGNFIRFWLSNWWNGMEWSSDVDNYAGAGRYNLKNAWLTDQVLDHCEKRGIRAIFTTLNHVRLKPAYSWPQHPYSIANGGWLRNPSEYWTDPKSREYSEKCLDYTVARFADSTSIHSWDYMSEVDLVSLGVWDSAKKMISSQLRYIGQIDPYRHITSNHLCEHNFDSAFYDMPENRFTQSNAYPGMMDLPDDQVLAVRTFSDILGTRNKPLMIAEFAGHWAGDPAPKMRRDTLSGLWAGVASSLSGLPLSWWWNFNYGEDLGRYYKVVAEFMEGEDLIVEDSPEKGRWINRLVDCSSTDGNLRALMVGNDSRRFVYAFNFDTICRSPLLPTWCRNNTIYFSGMRPGAYEVEYWDTSRGKTSIREAVTVDANGHGTLRPPAFTSDWAVKIYPDKGYPAAAGRTPDTAIEPAPTNMGAAVPETAGTWSWRIVPLVAVRAQRATARTLHEVRIALPASLRGAYPSITDTNGQPAFSSWSFLDTNRSGWLIQIPGVATGPFNIVPTNRSTASDWLFDERTVGLEVEVSQGRRAPLMRSGDFEAALADTPGGRTIRVPTIDCIENPTGSNDNFVAHYRGPILIPEDGALSFAINSDDGSFLRLNCRRVVEWLGGHNMEQQDRPLVNTWSHRRDAVLKQGMNWIEFYHQETVGAQLARVGWRHAYNSRIPVVVQPFDAGQARWEVLPPWVLDGRIPCAVEIHRDDKLACVIEPSIGLKFRRPEQYIAVVAVAATGDSAPVLHFFPGNGWAQVPHGNDRIPVWANNSHWRSFSLAQEQGIDSDGRRFVRTLLYDMDAPLNLRLGESSLGTKTHAARNWVLWNLDDSDIGKEFILKLGNVPLVTGTVNPWPFTDTRTIPPAKGKKIREYILPIAAARPLSIPGNAIQPGNAQGQLQAAATPACVQFDLWSQSPDDLFHLLSSGEAANKGVVLLLDEKPSILGITAAELRTMVHSHIQAVRRAGAEPVLVLGEKMDMAIPLMQQQALEFVRLSDELKCPFVDLRNTRL